MYKFPFDNKVTFAYGLFGAGKSHIIYRIDRRDDFHDLVLNLDNRNDDDKYYVTHNDFRIRNFNDVDVLSLPLYNLRITKQVLITYKHLYSVKNILCDEVQRVPVGLLIPFMKVLRMIFPKHSIGLFGIRLDQYNHECGVARHLLHHCRSTEIHCPCQFCSRQATKILMVYHGKVLTKSLSERIAQEENKKKDAIEEASCKYHVCDCHYRNLSVKDLLNVKPAIKYF